MLVCKFLRGDRATVQPNKENVMGIYREVHKYLLNHMGDSTIKVSDGHLQMNQKLRGDYGRLKNMKAV